MAEIWKHPEFSQLDWEQSSNKGNFREWKTFYESEKTFLAHPINPAYGAHYIAALQSSRQPPVVDYNTWWETHFSDLPNANADRGAVLAMKNFYQLCTWEPSLSPDMEIEKPQQHVQDTHEVYVNQAMNNCKWKELPRRR